MKPIHYFVIGLSWAAANVLGFGALMRFENAPGERANAATHWPSETRLTHSSKKLTLLVSLHPFCSCSLATIDELEKVVAAYPERMEITLLFALPKGLPGGWKESVLWRRTADIPGAGRIPDVGGVESRRFGMVTSGHVLLYDTSGRLLFSGGITASRGHAGDSEGKRRLLMALARPEDAVAVEEPTFGCALAKSHLTSKRE